MFSSSLGGADGLTAGGGGGGRSDGGLRRNDILNLNSNEIIMIREMLV